jgi:arylsulfatase B
MRPTLLLLLAGALAQPTQRPNLVVVIIDDYGHANIGYHARNLPNAAEIITPTLDSLAAEGVILDRHYSFKFCSPSRSALHTGRNPIHVNVLNSDLSAVNPADPISGFAGIPRPMSTFSSKLRDANYSTVMAGKWHLGLATPDHTPLGRGYTQSLAYLDGANDYFTSLTGDWCGAAQYTDLFAGAAPAYGQNSSWACSQANQAPGCRYEDDQFTAFALAAIAAHNASGPAPLLLYFAPHSVHMPLEVPTAQLSRFANVSTDSQPRRFYSAMTNYVDYHIGLVVAALKDKGMWDNTLLFLSADNGEVGGLGRRAACTHAPTHALSLTHTLSLPPCPSTSSTARGPIYGGGSGCQACNGNAGANNYPLRGGKHSNFEGGVRVNALVAGGLLPPSVRGSTLTALTAMEDVYPTLLALAGVEAFDHTGAAAGLPPVEGHNLWPLLSGANATAPRQEVWLGSSGAVHGGGSWGRGSGATPATFVQGLIRADGWKLLHDVLDNAAYQGPFYPNASTAEHPWNNSQVDCGSLAAPLCLYNVLADPTEHVNQAAARPDIVAAMAARLAQLQQGVFSPDRGSASPLACAASRDQWRGFVGPFMP